MTNRAPLWKQLVGALAGGSLALGLYGGYTFAKPQLQSLTGLLVIPQAYIKTNSTGSIRIADNDMEPWEVNRIADRAQRIAAEFSGTQNAAAPDEAAEDAPVQMIQMEPLPEEAEIAEAWEATEQVAAEPEEWDDTKMEAMVQYDKEEPPFYGNTDALPDSGIGMWLAAFVSFAIAGALLVRRKFATDAA
jgi:hypothetical protein